MSRRKSAVGELIDHLESPRKMAKNTALKVEPVGFKTNKQKLYFQAIITNQIVISTGVAGSGKSFIAVYAACCELAAGNIDKIIITKPAVEVGRTQGYLPGDMEEKMAPFIRSVEDCFGAIIGEAAYQRLLATKRIEILPLNYMRGLTFDDCIIIADEMQNADYAQTKALLTRLGPNAKLVINGDQEQSDLNSFSGLPDAIEVLKSVSGVGRVDFTIDDIVRSGIVKEILISYYHHEKAKKE